jgi:hypothetical protein
MSTLQKESILDLIRSRGRWRAVIRPCTFVEDRVAYSELLKILEKNTVRIRIWDYPFIDPSRPVDHHADWVGQGFTLMKNPQLWRFYQSGQFVHLFGMWEDWPGSDEQADQPIRRPVLQLYQALYHFTEIIEFASRLALSEAGDDLMHVAISLHRLQGRVLAFPSIAQPPSKTYRTSTPDYSWAREMLRTDLMADPRGLALEATKELLRRFGLDPDPFVLRALQESLGKRD